MRNEHSPTFKLGSLRGAKLCISNLENSFLPEDLLKEKEVNIWQPHYSDYYLLYYIDRGELTIMVDLKEIKLKGPTCFYVLPKQLKCLLTNSVASGWCLAIEESLVEKRLVHLLEQGSGIAPLILPSDNNISHVKECFKILYKIITDQKASLSIQIKLVSGCIEIIANLYLENNQNKQERKNYQTELAREFFSFLNEKIYMRNTNISNESKIDLSSKYLRASIKTITGKPISYWLHQEIIQEAKYLLFYTDLSVKEIAYNLGFKDHTYFSRFFSKGVGIGAAQFRKQFRNPNKNEQFFQQSNF